MTHGKPQLSFRHVECFRHVMLLHSTIAAAHAMEVSQSSVSRSISAMEQEIGFVLFTRDGNRMKPTVDALRLFEIVEKMSDGLEEIGRTATAIRSQQLGRIRIICLPVFLDTLVGKAVGHFSVLHPHLRFEVEAGGMARVMDEVGTGRFELGIGASAEGRTDVRSSLLERRSVVAVAPAGFRVGQSGVVTWAELASHPFIGLLPESPFRQLVDQQFARLGLAPAMVIEACNQRIAFQMAECGAGVTLVDARYLPAAAGNVQLLRLDEPMGWDCHLIFPRHEIAHHALRSFTSFLRQQVH
ncbi:LysR family transcriptional regulator [Comamonas humi]